jgi:hypothetical protein
VANGARFRLVAEPIWIIPKPGEERSLSLSLEITNLAAEKRRFCLLDSIYVLLKDRCGNFLPLQGGRDHLLKKNPYTPPLVKGQCYAVKHFEGKLCWDELGKLRLQGQDGFGGWWFYTDIVPGHYWLIIAYANDSVLQEKRVVPLWNGKAVTNAVKVQVK